MRTIRTALLVVLVVAVGMGGAVAARSVVAARGTATTSAARPGPAALPLTTTVTVPRGPDGRPGFTFRAPGPPERVATPESTGNELFALRVAGARAVAILGVAFDGPADPVAQLATTRDRMTAAGLMLGPTTRVRLAAGPAAYADLRTPSGRVVREFRFARDGRSVGVGVAFMPEDEGVAVDTALAVFATWRWTG
jgi:hypothetical protein